MRANWIRAWSLIVIGLSTLTVLYAQSDEDKLALSPGNARDIWETYLDRSSQTLWALDAAGIVCTWELPLLRPMKSDFIDSWADVPPQLVTRWKTGLDSYDVINEWKKAPSPDGTFYVSYRGYEYYLIGLPNNDTLYRCPLVPDFEIHRVHVLSDNTLLLAGMEGLTSKRPGLYRMDWKNNCISANFAKPYMPGGALFLADVATDEYGALCFFEKRFRSWRQRVAPANLENTFTDNLTIAYLSRIESICQRKELITTSEAWITPSPESGQESGNLPDDAHAGTNWHIEPLTSGKDALISLAADSVVAVIDHLDGYTVNRLHSDRSAILWRHYRMQDYRAEEILLITDLWGTPLFTDTIAYNREQPERFSRDGRWFCYRKNKQIFCWVNLEHPTQRYQWDTGSPQDIQAGVPQFDQRAPVTQLIFGIRHLHPNGYSLIRMDLTTGAADTLFRDTLAFIRLPLPAFALDRAGRQLAIADGQHPAVRLIDLLSCRAQRLTMPLPVENLIFHGSLLTAVTADGRLLHRHLGTGAEVIQEVDGDRQLLTTAMDFHGSPDLFHHLVIYDPHGRPRGVDGKADRHRQRPDRLMRLLGNTDQSILALYERAYHKRMAQPSNRIPSADKSVPALAIEGKLATPLVADTDTLPLQVSLSQATVNGFLTASVNGYRVFNGKGFRVGPGNESVCLSIPLDTGLNQITLQYQGANGRYSLPLFVQAYARYPKMPHGQRLHILAIGVSDYADAAYHLDYAAKDAADVADVLRHKGDFEAISYRLLLDSAVTREHILQSIAQANDLNKNDILVLYLAGHGVLGDDGQFYFATHPMDFAKPARVGLSYTQLVQAIDSLPMRHKVVLLDACHSGHIDRSNPAGRPPDVKEVALFHFMQQLFAEYRADNGLHMLTATRGTGEALEHRELGNGLFSYALIRGLGLAECIGKHTFFDGDIDWKNPTMERQYGEQSVITLDDLGPFVIEEVRRLSHGRQLPGYFPATHARQVSFREDVIPGYFADTPEGLQYRAFLETYKTSNKRH